MFPRFDFPYVLRVVGANLIFQPIVAWLMCVFPRAAPIALFFFGFGLVRSSFPHFVIGAIYTNESSSEFIQKLLGEFSPFQAVIILVSKWGGGLFRRSSNRISRARASCSFASASSTSHSRAVSCKLARTMRTFLPRSSLWGSWQESDGHQCTLVLKNSTFQQDF